MQYPLFTSPPEERVELLKPLDGIKEMGDNCEEIYPSSLLKRYSKCPTNLEHFTLADWVAWYDYSGKPYINPMNGNGGDGSRGGAGTS